MGVSASQHRLLMAVATLGPVGHLKRAPGTWASAITLPLAFALLWAGGPIALAIAALCVIAFGIHAGGHAVRELKREDPSEIVVDEVAGMMLALLPALPGGLISMVAAFLLFRFFDIVKPWPISLIDRRVTGGIGVMADDVAAGILAAASLMLLRLAGAV
ncbi:MAG TPA: phosphatidylglycerophosphatase A [Micropepsaceae bacterium]|nr:phosphatidylglycerophosphatase A [Micropepsaceae bacterium]